MKGNDSAKLFINKSTAANRQLSAAIRLVFLEEDELAIHTIAAASYNILSDILRSRGKEEWSWPYEYGLLRMAYDIAHNDVEGHLDVSEEVLNLAKEISVEFLRNPELKPENLRVSGIPESEKRRFFDKRKTANYLKHADRDSGSLLDASSVDNIDLIIRAINCFSHCGFDPSDEMFFFIAVLPNLGHPTELVTFYRPHEVQSLDRSAILKLGREVFCSNSREQADQKRQGAMKKELMRSIYFALSEADI